MGNLEYHHTCLLALFIAASGHYIFDTCNLIKFNEAIIILWSFKWLRSVIRFEAFLVLVILLPINPNQSLPLKMAPKLGAESSEHISDPTDSGWKNYNQQAPEKLKILYHNYPLFQCA